ncbi:MAG: hypothetical protein Q9162_000927 [Coniocarpon cinnabarinum]
MYGINYTVPESSHDNRARFHARMYAFAESGRLVGLKSKSLERFKAEASKGREGAAAAFSAAESVYNKTMAKDKELKRVLVDAVHDHIEVVQNAANKTILKAVPEFAYDLVVKRAHDQDPADEQDKLDEWSAWGLPKKKTKKAKYQVVSYPPAPPAPSEEALPGASEF